MQRRDDLVEVFQRVARVFAGWHPAVWWLGRQLHIEREAACDEMAVTLTGSSKHYASCLLKLAGLPMQRQSISPALGMLSSPVVSTRIQRIVNYHCHASPTWSTTAAGVGIVLLAGATCVIGSLRVVEAAQFVSSEVVPAGTVVQSLSTPPASEAPRANVAAADSPTPAPASRKASRRVPLATSEAPRIAVMPAAEAHVDSALIDVSPDPAETGAIAADLLLTKPAADTSPPAASPQPPSDAQLAPWTAAANAGVSVGNAGVALGKRSKQGGVATGALVFPYSSPVALIWGLKKGDEAVLRGSRVFSATVTGDSKIAGLQPRPEGVVYRDRETVKASTAPPTNTSFPRESFRPKVSMRPN